MPDSLPENPYDRGIEKGAVVERYRRVHANSEQTHVVILDAARNSFVAIAYDIDPREYQPVAADIIGYDPTLEGVEARAERWMTEHPKGVAGDDTGSSGGIVSKLLAVIERLNEYGNDLAEPHAQDADNGSSSDQYK